MRFLRGFVLTTWVVVMSLCIGLVIIDKAFSDTVLNVEKTKKWLAESTVYESLRDTTLADYVRGIMDERYPENKLIDDDVLKASLAETLPKEELIKRTEPVVDNFYAWLDSREPDVKYSINFDDRKNQFYRSLEVKLGQKIEKLRTCEIFSYPPETSVIEDLCLPSFLTPGEAQQAVMGNIRGQDFPFTTLDNENFPILASMNTTTKRLPTYLNYLWVLNLVAICVLVFAVIYLVVTRRSLGIIAIGVSLIAGGFLAWFTQASISNGVLSMLAQQSDTARKLGSALLPHFSSVSIRYVLISIAIGAFITAVGSAWKYRQRRAEA